MTPREGNGDGREERVAAHPIWACDSEAIKDEYRRALDERDKWLSWHQRADSQVERLSFAIEQHQLAKQRTDGSDEADQILYDALRHALKPASPQSDGDR